MTPEEILQAIQFECKRDVSSVSEQRHFEDMEKLCSGGVIDPFRAGKIVPHFPEKSTHERSERKREHRTPVPVLEALEKMGATQPPIYRLKDQRQGTPNKRVTVFRPNECQYQ